MRKLSFLILILLVGMQLSAQNSKVRTCVFALQAGDLDKAREAIEEAIVHEKTMNDPKAWHNRGETYLRIHTSEEYGYLDSNALDIAYTSYMKSMEYDSKGEFTNENLRGLDLIRNIYFGIGTQSLQEGEYEKTYMAFDRTLGIFSLIVENTPAEQLTATVDTISMFYKAYAAQNLGKKEEAMATYEQLVEMGFKDKFVYDLLSKMYLAEKRYDDALAVIRRGQEILPEDTDLLIDELNVYLAQGNAEQAVDRFEKAIELEPENADLRFALGTILDRLYERANQEGDEEMAVEYLDKLIKAYEGALEIDPEYFKAAYNIGVLFFNEAVEVSKEMNNLPLSAKAEYDAMEEEMTALMLRAKPYLEQAHQLDPTDLGTMKALKEIYLRENDMENFKKMNEAIKEAESGTTE